MRRRALLALALACLAAPGGAVDYGKADARWWSAGDGRVFPASASYDNENGKLTTISPLGPMTTRGHPFFTALGNNGRACVTCHQPADGMSLSVASVRQRWAALGPKDPLFAAVDGANCPDLPQAEQASHSLLLSRGLFRIALPWPPRGADGKAIAPEFDIEVVRDPTGCNGSAQYGLHGAARAVSVYRRPRPVANLKYITAVGFSFDPKSGLPLLRDPDSGEFVSEALMADSRLLTLPAQAADAMRTHLQMQGNPNPEQLRRIVAFESQLASAQSHDAWGGSLDEGGARGGPAAIAAGRAGVLQSTSNPIWNEFFAWKKDPPGSPEQQAYRASVARGAELFSKRMFLVRGSAGINSMGFGDPVRNSCAMCHNMQGAGIDVAPGRIDIGTANEPHAKPAPELPLFRLTCRDGARPHPFLGKVVYTQDPGYALTTGRCEDIGKIMTQSMRGLSGRAPYFSNGSAADLRELVQIYDRRYNIHFSEQEIADLVNLMKAL